MLVFVLLLLVLFPSVLVKLGKAVLALIGLIPAMSLLLTLGAML